MALPTAPQIVPLLTRSFIYLKNKQIEVIHENSKNLNQTKLIFRHALGNARYRGGNPLIQPLPRLGGRHRAGSAV